MRTRPALALVFPAAVLLGGCSEPTEASERTERSPASVTATESPALSWDGKADEEDAMARATRALNAVEPESAARVDAGLERLAEGLEKTFTAPGDDPYAFDVACQAPEPRALTLLLVRGEDEAAWEVKCGDREADQFDIPAGASFTARIAPSERDADGLVLWRLGTIAPDDAEGCADDIEGCEG